MATVFIFDVKYESRASAISTEIYNKKDFRFLYKWEQKKLFLYNLELLNDVLIDLLINEFSQYKEFNRHIKITRDIINRYDVMNMLLLQKCEYDIIEAVCDQWE